MENCGSPGGGVWISNFGEIVIIPATFDAVRTDANFVYYIMSKNAENEFVRAKIGVDTTAENEPL